MKMRNLLRTAALTAATLLLWTTVGWGQEIVAAWTFPTLTGNETANIAAECGTMSGSSIIYADGTNGSSNWLGTTGAVTYFGGAVPSSSLCDVTTATGALSLVNIGSAFNGSSIVFKLSLTGYENLSLSYDTRGTATGFQNHEWLYSTNGVDFTTVTTITGRNATSFSSQSVDFSSISAIDNQASIYIKVILSGATGTGNNRFDNVKFSASVLTGGDTNPPVATFAPLNGATDVAIDVHPTITFNEAIRNIDDSEITNANVASLLTLTDPSKGAVPFTATIDGDKKVITITPNANLANEEVYTVGVAPVEDASDNATLLQTASFTTISNTTPVITLTSTHTGPYYASDDVVVEWTSANIDMVHVEIWIPIPGYWATLNSATGASGTTTIQIPTNAQYNTNYKIRVKPSDAETPVSESAAFKVRAVAQDLITVRGYAVNDEFRFDGEAIVTFTRPAGAPGYNQKYIVDENAGMLIHDASTVITTPYAIGDGISGLVARRAVFNQLVQIVPLADPGAPVSTGNEIVPEVKTLSNITSADQGKLVKVYGVTFASAGSFTAGQNYTITDASKASMLFRTQFAEADYIGQPIPQGTMDLVMLVGQFNADIQLSARSLTDIQEYPQLIVIGGDANGTVSSDLDGYYPEGQQITAEAFPFEGYLFHNWTDDNSNILSTENPYTFNMPATDLTLIGNFRAIVNGSIDPNQLTFYQNWDNGIFTTTITWGDATEVTGMSYWDVEEEMWVPLPTTMWEVIDDNGVTATLNIDLAQAPDKMLKNAKADYVIGSIPWRVEFDLGQPAMGETLLTVKTFVRSFEVVNPDSQPIEGATVEVEPYSGNGNPGVVWNVINPTSFEVTARGDYFVTVSASGFETHTFSLENVEDDGTMTIELTPSTPTEFMVTFEVVDGINGTIRAFVNSSEIWSGSNVFAGSDVLFEAFPFWGFMVKEWKVNGTVVDGYVLPEYTYSNLQSDIHVTVEFEPFIYPEIQPEEQLFSILAPADVEFEVVWGSESEITGIDYSYWTEEDEQVIVPLVAGVDYTLVDNTITISQSFIEDNYQDVGDWMQFVAKFGLGSEVSFYVIVVYSENPILLPSEISYDLTNPSDVFTNIMYAEAEAITSVSVGGTELVEGEDYHIDGTFFFVHNSYLSSLLTEVDDVVVIDVEFDSEDVATLTITAIESGVVNATIDPTSVTYYVMPEYQDITITWNDATAVTGLNVKLNFGFGFEEFEWPFYEVTDNGDGTANLRIFFDEVDKKTSKETTYITNALITISFDAGAPSYFFMTIVETYYDVIVNINPEEAGWVWGAYDYREGETVELGVGTNFGYRFVNWTDEQGVVLSTDPEYTFVMPAQDVVLNANFERVYYIHFSVFEVGEGIIYLNDAQITLGDVTNEPGDYQFQMPVGSYTYFVTKEGYLTVTGTVNVVDEDLIINVPMVAGTNPTYSVTFNVVDINSNPITDAVVTFNGVEGAVGEYTFTDVEPGVYSFSIAKDGFVTFDGSVTVTNENVTVPVTLNLVSINTNTFANFSAYPNPFSSTINLSNPSVVSRVVVTNIIGQRVMDVATNGASSIETASLPAGVYLVTFEAASGERIIRKMIKK